MSFEYTPVSKGLMIGCALTSITVALFDVKQYFHLQLSPHISKHHQYWRLFSQHLAFTSSTDLLLAELLLYNVAVHVERRFGSLKFASYVAVSTLVSTLIELSVLLAFHRLGINKTAGGPTALLFNILYQYSRIVPPAYRFRIFGIAFTNNIFVYALGLQLAISRLPGSAVIALIGLITGQLYRSDLANLKTYRISPTLARFASDWIVPLIGPTRPPRRTNRALPDDSSSSRMTTTYNEEVITTAPTAPSSPPASSAGTTEATTAGTAPGVVREWVDELTGRADRQSVTGGMRVPSEGEIVGLTDMFPDLQRSVVVAALQRSTNVEGAVEILLSAM